MADIVMYTRDWCGYCAAAKALFKKKGIAFEEINATGNNALRAEMVERSSGGSTFPQILIDGVPVGGCDELFALEDSGQLDKMLAASE